MKAPFLREVLDGMPDSVKIIDDQFRIVFANNTARSKIHQDLNDVRGRPCHQVINGFKDRCFFCNTKKVFETGEPQVGYCTLSSNGSLRDFQVSVFPMKGDGQRVEYAVEIVKDITTLSKGAPLPRGAGNILSRDRTFGWVFEQMAQCALDDGPVLVQGEKGTGKKSFAQALHQRSARSPGPFRIFHCENPAGSGDSGGLFGENGEWHKAAGGTLYLDSLDLLGKREQEILAEKLSRPAGPGAPRVVAGTRVDLQHLAREKAVLPGLYDRFASHILRLPALRDRRQDLPFLAQHFIETYKVVTGSPAEKLGPDALCQLLSYSWPGNLRELETTIERACLMATGPKIEKLDLPICAPQAEKLDEQLSLTEKAFLVDALTKSQGRLGKAAQGSGLSLKTFQRKMTKHGLKAGDFKHLPGAVS